jgi:hypothetical protein
MKENKQVVGNQKVTLLNPEILGLRDLPKNKKFILPYSPHLRRLVEDENERKKGFLKIEVLHGNAWFSGYISHAIFKKNLPLQYV